MHVFAPFAQPAQHSQTIDFGQHKVKHNHVVIVGLGVPEPLFTIAGDVDGIAEFAQPRADGLLKPGGIFNKQQTHSIHPFRFMV